MNIQKYKNFNFDENKDIVNYQKNFISFIDERCKLAEIKEERFKENIYRIEKDKKNDLTTGEEAIEPMAYYVKRFLTQIIPGDIISILSLFLYIPMTLLWIFGEFLKICFVWTPIYDYFVYSYGSIYSKTIKLQNDLIVHSFKLKEVLISENDINYLNQKNLEFSEYSVWELFYKK